MSNPVFRLIKGIFGVSQDWWVEIKTSSPRCTYYFGPFEAEQEAVEAKHGYIEDLEQEGAQDIQAAVMQCSKPQQLTISEDSEEFRGGLPSPVLSS